MSKHYYFNLFESLINEAGRSTGRDIPDHRMGDGITLKNYWRKQDGYDPAAGAEMMKHYDRHGFKAWDTFARRKEKVAQRSSLGGTLKRGLAKAAGKLGIGRYSAAGKAKANLGEAVKLRAIFEAVLLSKLQD